MARFIVPGVGISETQQGIPVESPAPPSGEGDTASKPRRSKPAPVPAPAEIDEPEEEEADETPPPRKKRRRDPDAEDDDDAPTPPRRSRRDEPDDDEDEEDDDRPRRRRKSKRRSSKGGNSTLIYVLVGIAVVLLLGCGGGGLILYLVMNSAPSGPTEVQFGPDNTFRSNSSLRVWDPIKDGKHFRSYSLRVEAGKTYDIDMHSGNIDSFLFLLDENNVIQQLDDDAGGGLNALIVFRPQRNGIFRIEATSFEPGETGSYSLVVRRK